MVPAAQKNKSDRESQYSVYNGNEDRLEYCSSPATRVRLAKENGICDCLHKRKKQHDRYVLKPVCRIFREPVQAVHLAKTAILLLHIEDVPLQDIEAVRIRA